MQRFIRITFLTVGVLATVAAMQREAGAVMAHRWMFNEGATGDASNRVIVDSVGDADGVVKGTGASATAGGLVLTGGNPDVLGYVDLPNGMISQNFTDMTIEAFYTIHTIRAWSRIFDFGSTTAGEHDTPMGTGDGFDNFYFAPMRNTNINQQRVEFQNNDPLFGGSTNGAGNDGLQLNPNVGQSLNSMQHVRVTFDADGGDDPGEGLLTVYMNGNQVAQGDTTNQLENLNDVNNWFGRSNWTNDQQFGGELHEIRIFDDVIGGLTPGESYGQRYAVGLEASAIPGPGELRVEVNRSSGAVTLYNDFDFASGIELEYWLLESDDGLLTPGVMGSNVNSLDGDAHAVGEGFEVAGGSSEFAVGEAILDGSVNVAMNAAPFNLGNLFAGGEDGDLEFFYKPADSAALVQGLLTYVGEVGDLMADFNGDNVVDALDYVILRDGLGGEYSNADYLQWREEYGMTAGSGAGGSLNAVPEPASWQILFLAAAMALCFFARSNSLRTCSLA